MRFFSYNTPKEITLDLISFQKGWERGDWIHVGNSLEKVITIVDENKILPVSQVQLQLTQLLKKDIFLILLHKLKTLDFLKKIDVINKKTTSGMDIDNMTLN